jgi:hypothetical protein
MVSIAITSLVHPASGEKKHKTSQNISHTLLASENACGCKRSTKPSLLKEHGQGFKHAMQLLDSMKRSLDQRCIGGRTKAVVQAHQCLPVARHQAANYPHQQPSSSVCASRAANVLAAAVLSLPTRPQSTIAIPQVSGHRGGSRFDILGLGQAMVGGGSGDLSSLRASPLQQP